MDGRNVKNPLLTDPEVESNHARIFRNKMVQIRPYFSFFEVVSSSLHVNIF